jgi:hypothetical protein
MSITRSTTRTASPSKASTRIPTATASSTTRTSTITNPPSRPISSDSARTSAIKNSRQHGPSRQHRQLYVQRPGHRATKANVFNPLGYLANTLKDVRTTGFVYSNTQSDYYVQNASFLKMDNLGLSYNARPRLPQRRQPADQRQLPERVHHHQLQGTGSRVVRRHRQFFYPRPRTYTLGFNLQF